MAEGCIDVTAGVIARKSRVLVCQRPPGGHHPGKWEFPGGKVESPESLAAALRRELQEELGIDARIGPVIWRTHYQYEGRPPFVLTFFSVPHFTGTPTNRIFATIRWVPVGALRELDFLEGDREFIAQLDRGGVRLD